MEVKFLKKPFQCLRPFVSQVHSQEQIQEVRLPDAYPDIGKVLGCWGQPMIRGKEWRSTSMGANGGVMAWVLYAPEDGTQPRVVDVWIPFQCRWDFPESAEDGTVTICPTLTELDGRGISARKMMVRAGIDTYGQGMRREKLEIAQPPEMEEDIQVLKRVYPMEVPMEAGEKQVQLEETLSLPTNNPPIQKIVGFKIVPTVEEQKVLGNRLVFRGTAKVHLLYLTEEGNVVHWDTEVPFSQYTELDRDYEPGASAWVMPILTAGEMELSESGQPILRAGIAAQYAVFDRAMVEVVEDAFSPKREVSVKTEPMQMPMLLDSTDIDLFAEGNLSGVPEQMVSMNVCGEYPRIYVEQDGVKMGMEGRFHTLYKDREGQLTSDSAPFRAETPLAAAPENLINLWLGAPGEPEMMTGPEETVMRTRYPVTVQSYSGNSIPMVTELEIGVMEEPSTDRPAIILRRAGEESLWDIAKECGSTVAAIKNVNGLSEEPAIGQMLLIPIS